MVRVRKKILKYEEPNRPKVRYYSFLTIALLVCILILLKSTVANIITIISYHGKINELKKIQVETTDKNHNLKKQLNDLDSRSYEAIARNNLKMSGEDEVLIIIHEPEEINSKDKKKNFQKRKKENNADKKQ